MSETLAEKTTSPLRHQFPDTASYVTVGAAEVVADFGDVAAEYAAIRSAAARFDLSGAGLVEVSGDDAYDLLQNALARDLEFVTPEQSLFSALLDADGHAVDVVTVYHHGGGFRLETSVGRGPEVVEHLAGLARDHDYSVEITANAENAAIVLVEGPEAGRVMEEAIDPDLSALPLSGLLEVGFNGVDILVSRTGFTGEFGYKVFVPADDAAVVWKALSHLPAAGFTALEAAMFEVRQPLVPREAGSGLSALQLGYAWVIDVTKDEFTGHDAVIEAFESGVRSEVVGFVTADGVPATPGALVRVGGEVVGEVLYSLTSPARGVVGLARLRPELVAPGVAVELGDEPVAATTIASPYVIPVSWTQR